MHIKIIKFRIIDHYHEKILEGVYRTKKEANAEVERLIKEHKRLKQSYDYDIDAILPGVSYEEYIAACDE